MIATQRYEKIIEMVNERGVIHTGELAQLLGVTETTIRRDCEKLEKQAALIRVHGGVKSRESQGILSSFHDRTMRERTERYVEKDLVCQAAAALVKEGDCIYLDSGTTVVPMLKYLRGKQLKIVTPSLLIAEAFQDPGSELLVIGGRYMIGYDMMGGSIATEYLQRFRFDLAFLGCSGIDLKNGFVYTGEIDTMSLKETAIQCALKKYLLIDTTKLFVKGFYGPLKHEDFDAVFCNQDRLLDPGELPNNFKIVQV
ncbi:MAG: DeoR/GlpR transcriptional regulator [Lachnospiraceae bacterium]|nr:DeoR/GlpR transcriptional regulator [Lachnospiraceae bacterium]